MRELLMAVPVVLGGCATTPATPGSSEPLQDACDAQVCPADPPEYIDCMPVVTPEWQPICREPCRSFLEQSCKIRFTD
jgi:hypothetical protein